MAEEIIRQYPYSQVSDANDMIEKGFRVKRIKWVPSNNHFEIIFDPPDSHPAEPSKISATERESTSHSLPPVNWPENWPNL